MKRVGLGDIYFLAWLGVYFMTLCPTDIDTNYLSYPLSNAILVVPLSVVRWIENTGPNDITSTDTLAAAIIFSFSGVTNVLLLLYIRPNLLLFGRDTNHCEHCMGLLMPQVDPVEMQPVEGNAAEWRHPFADGYEHSGRAQQGQDIP